MGPIMHVARRQEFVSASRPEVIDSYSAAHKSKKNTDLWEENYSADPLAKAVQI